MNKKTSLFFMLASLTGCPGDDEPAGDTGGTTGDPTTGAPTSASSSSSTTDEPSSTEDSSASDDASASESGTASSSSSTGEDTLEIIGEYDDDFGGRHEISMETWIYDSGMGVYTTNLMSFDNEASWVAGEDADNPGTFLRFDWTVDADEQLWYCTAVFDATSLDEAEAAPPSDATDPATGGCGSDFPWTMLTPAA